MTKRGWKRQWALGVALLLLFSFSSCAGREHHSTDGSNLEGSSHSSDRERLDTAFSDGDSLDAETVDRASLVDLSKLQPDGALVFTFSDASVSATVSSESYEITGTALKIKESGTYFLTGTCADGSVTVAKQTSDVFLVLDGLHLSSSTGPALVCNRSSSVCIYLQPNSKNTLSDVAAEHEEGAALKFKSGAALTLAGDGNLTVTGQWKNGINGAAGSTLQIRSGNLTVTAKNNAIACDDQLYIDGGTLYLTAGNDGIKASPKEEDPLSAGNIDFRGGTITVTAVGDGISADGAFTCSGGIIDVTTTGEISVFSGNSFGGFGGFGGWGSSQSSDGDDASSKGIKAGSGLTISGGTITVSSTDHALHCSAKTIIQGGTLLLNSSKAKGIATHGDLVVEGNETSVTIENATEGIESKASFTMNGGTVRIENATDDGINMGGTVSSSNAEDHTFTMNGGTLYVFAQGDGLDSNGTFCLNDGMVIVFGPSNGGNSCLDVQFLSSYQGGTLLGAASSSSMWN
ncbi:MAG: carbohydrate-binding domain-containing protein, partial [Clostridia bacterium]|nr:carbohydrate-binding domain-containing protein [Clostridia bacterium]